MPTLNPTVRWPDDSDPADACPGDDPSRNALSNVFCNNQYPEVALTVHRRFCGTGYARGSNSPEYFCTPCWACGAPIGQFTRLPAHGNCDDGVVCPSLGTRPPSTAPPTPAPSLAPTLPPTTGPSTAPTTTAPAPPPTTPVPTAQDPTPAPAVNGNGGGSEHASSSSGGGGGGPPADSTTGANSDDGIPAGLAAVVVVVVIAILLLLGFIVRTRSQRQAKGLFDARAPSSAKGRTPSRKWDVGGQRPGTSASTVNPTYQRSDAQPSVASSSDDSDSGMAANAKSVYQIPMESSAGRYAAAVGDGDDDGDDRDNYIQVEAMRGGRSTKPAGTGLVRGGGGSVSAAPVVTASGQPTYRVLGAGSSNARSINADVPHVYDQRSQQQPGVPAAAGAYSQLDNVPTSAPSDQDATASHVYNHRAAGGHELPRMPTPYSALPAANSRGQSAEDTCNQRATAALALPAMSYTRPKPELRAAPSGGVRCASLDRERGVPGLVEPHAYSSYGYPDAQVSPQISSSTSA